MGLIAPRDATQGSRRAPTGRALTGTVPARPRRADVIAAYDLGVECYERLWSPVILPGAAALIPLLGLVNESIVLDVGAGTGALVDLIRSAAPGAKVVALDASRQMLHIARTQRTAPAVQADAMALPIVAHAVHTVVLAYVLFHLADPLAALREAARVVRPEGRVGTVTWASECPERAQIVWNDALTDAGVPPLPPRRVDTGLDHPRALDALLRKAGLVPQRIWAEQLRCQWDPTSFWTRATGLGSSQQRLGLIDPEARAGLLASLRAQLNDLAAEDYLWEGEVICAVASKPRIAPAALLL